ncbi:MAG: hypothetical protein AAB923_00745 [Patescibacteria group bacterium]
MDDKAAPTLDEVYKLTKENNKLLRAMRRDSFVKGVLGFVWWIFILVVVPYFTYLYLKPYFDIIIAQYQQVQGQSAEAAALIEQFKQAGSGFPDIAKLFQQFMGGGK